MRRPNFEPCHGLKAIEGFGLKAMEAEGWLGGSSHLVLLVQTEAANFLLTVERVRWNPPGQFWWDCMKFVQKISRGKNLCNFLLGIIYWFFNQEDGFSQSPNLYLGPPKLQWNYHKFFRIYSSEVHIYLHHQLDCSIRASTRQKTMTVLKPKKLMMKLQLSKQNLTMDG